MPVFRLSSKGGLYNPQNIRTVGCMLSTVYGGAGSYKRTYIFDKLHPQLEPNGFEDLVTLVRLMTFPTL